MATTPPGTSPGAIRSGRARVTDISVVLLAHPGGPPLHDLLSALAAQTVLPQRILICGLDPQTESSRAAAGDQVRQDGTAEGPLGQPRPDLGTEILAGGEHEDDVPLEDGPAEGTGTTLAGAEQVATEADLARAHPGLLEQRVPVLIRPTLPLPKEGRARGVTEPQVWQVVDDARAALPVHDDHWLWFLHDDSLPEPDALEALASAVRRNSRVGVVGPKLVRADDPRLLLGVGHHVTPAGREADMPQAALVDQGQLDLRQDVLGVPLAGALVRSDVLSDIGGIDPAFGSDGVDGLDLGWRTHLAGHRVVVATDAVVRQGQDGLGVVDPRRTRMRRRQLALARGSWFAGLWRGLGVALTSALAAILLLLVKRPHEAGDEWADVRGALSPWRGLGARWRFRKRRTVRPRDLHGLFVSRGTGWRSTLDTVGEAMDPRARDTTSRAEAAAHHPGARGTGETGPVSDEFSDLGDVGRHRSRWSWALVAAVLAALALVGWRWRSLLGSVQPGGPGLSGAELGPGATDAHGLWRSALDGWRGGGLGHASPAEPWLVPASALTRLVELLPGGAGGIATAGVTLSLLLLMAAPLSVITAYLALRRATRRRWVRAALALGWAGSLPLTAAVAQGRVGPALVHVLAPLLVAGFAVAAVPQRSVRRTAATFGTALGVVLAAQWVPIVLLVSTVAGLLLFLGGRRPARWRGPVLAVLPWVLMLPWLPSVWSAPVRLFGGAGATVASNVHPGLTPAWQSLLLNPGAAVDPAGWAAAPLWATVPLWLAALAALALPGPGGRRAGVLVLGALLTLGGALLLSRLALGVLPGGHAEAGQTVTAWPGTLLSLTGAAVLLAAAVLLEHLIAGVEVRRARAEANETSEGDQTAGGARWQTLLTGIVATVLLASAVGVLGWHALVPQSTPEGQAQGAHLARAVPPLPAVAGEQARGPSGLRTLVVVPGATDETAISADSADSGGPGTGFAPDDTAYRVVVDLRGSEPEPSRLLRDRAQDLAKGRPAPGPVEQAVATMTGDGTPAEAVEALRSLAVGYVQVDAGPDHPLVTTIDRIPGLTRVSSPAGQVLWRLTDHQNARVQAVGPDGEALAPLTSTGPHGDSSGPVRDLPEGSALSVSEGAGWSEHASVLVDGEPVALAADGTVPLPAGDHEVSVGLRTPSLPWHLAALALALVTGFLALPFGRTETQTKEEAR